MPRFLVETPYWVGDTVEISGAEARHIHKVLRLKEGDEIILFDGKGMEYWGTIESQKFHRVVVKVEGKSAPRRESPIEVVLGQGLLKGDKMDYVFQKTTEMGISAIFPFVSSRTIPKSGGEQAERRWRRWRRIVVESTKQCGRTVPPRVEDIRSFGSLLDWPSREFVKLILWEKELTPLKERLRQMHGQSKKFLFLVGPEGGFCEEEISAAEGRGFISVGVGPRTLRSETVGVAVLSILQYEFGDWRIPLSGEESDGSHREEEGGKG
jgi:16S rRNA (uracil1498-N3)-methyltransferase